MGFWGTHESRETILEELYGKQEPWREPLGALRLTLSGSPDTVDVTRAQLEVEWLTRVLNEEES